MDLRVKKNPLDSEDKRWMLRTEAGHRLMEIRSTSFQLVRQDLIQIVGKTVASQLLYRVGISIGKSAYSSRVDKVNTEEECWAFLDDMTQSRGWGQIFDHKKVEGSDATYRVILRDSALADDQVNEGSPVCDLMRGIIGGWLASHYERPLLSVEETLCLAAGSIHCEFFVTLASNTASAFASAFSNSR